MTNSQPGFTSLDYAVVGAASAVALLTLSRPDAANALNATLIDELDAALDRADADDNVRVVVIAGEGKHFCAGPDL